MSYLNAVFVWTEVAISLFMIFMICGSFVLWRKVINPARLLEAEKWWPWFEMWQARRCLLDWGDGAALANALIGGHFLVELGFPGVSTCLVVTTLGAVFASMILITACQQNSTWIMILVCARNELDPNLSPEDREAALAVELYAVVYSEP